jgi:uncharacterized protein
MEGHKGKLAVITGATSGIGLELAREFAENGFDLLLTSKEEEIHQAANNLETYGTNVKALEIDLSTYEGVEILYEKMKSSSTPIYAIAMNADSRNWTENKNDLKKEMEDLKINIVSLVHLSKRILPDFVAKNEGKILFASREEMDIPNSQYAIHEASKAFVNSFSEALASELKDTNVTVATIEVEPSFSFVRNAATNESIWQNF